MPPIRISIVDQIYGIYQKIINGLNISVGSGTVSSSNPLPTTTTQLPTNLGVAIAASSVSVVGTYGSFSTIPEYLAGRVSKITASVAAVSGQFGRIQLANPANNTKDIVLAGLTTLAGTAGTYTYAVYEIPIANVGTLTPSVETNFKIGDGASGLLVYYANSATAIPTTGLVAGGAHTSITQPGAVILYSGGNICIPIGKAIEIAISTANIGMSVNIPFYAFPRA